MTLHRFHLVTTTWLIAACLASTASAQSPSLQRASVDSEGNQAEGQIGAHSNLPSISDDGRRVVFASIAENLVSGSANGHAQIYVHDRWTGQTLHVSKNARGVPADNECRGPRICGAGTFVVFDSDATNLILHDANGHASDVFLYELASDSIRCVSLSTTGAQGNGDSFGANLSWDGRYVQFTSSATDLVPQDTNATLDVFVRELSQGGSTRRVSLSSAGVEGDRQSSRGWITADGLRVVFESDATNLAPPERNRHTDIFQHDLASATTTLVSQSSTGVQGDAGSFAAMASADGRHVCFLSEASNLIAHDGNGQIDVFVRDLQAGTTECASLSSSGSQTTEGNLDPAISGDGRYVTFTSWAKDLVDEDHDGFPDVYLRDRQSGSTSLLSRNAAGEVGNSFSGSATPSADGSFVAFSSAASNLTPGDTNASRDIFVVDRNGCTSTRVVYCTSGSSSHGCAGTLQVLGVPSASAGSGFEIRVTEVEGQRLGLLFYGISGSDAVPWDSSYLCLRSPFERMVVQPSGGQAGACDGSLSVDWNAYVATHPQALGAPFRGGETVWAQAWLRDPGSQKGSNLSDAVWFSVCP